MRHCRTISGCLAIFGVFTICSVSQADPYPPVDQNRPPLVIKHHGIFWAGGTIRTRTQQGTETSGSVQVPIAGNLELVNQLYVEYYIPQAPKGPPKPPIFMVPGGGLISVHYLTTPDGREGWADYFLRLGYPVYMIDPPGRGRAGWSVDQYNDFINGVPGTPKPPTLGRSDSSQWLEWNTGPTFGVWGPHDPSCTGDDNRGSLHIYCNGDQMPKDQESLKHWLGALVQTGPSGGGNDAYIAAIQKIMAYHKSKVIYLGHSAGGSTGGQLANAHPELFEALIALEPAAGCPFTGTLDQLAGLKQVPLLSLHGINQVGRPTTPGCLDAYDAINAAGGDATFFSLLLLPNDPRFPFYSRIPLNHQFDDWGTDHLMFWDTSSDKVAGVVADWLENHVVKAPKN
jgi:pimeloyl-ACP methyl ester carboxylesterase